MQLCGWTQVSVCKGASSSVLVPTLHKWIPYTAWSVWGFGGAGVSVFLERGSTQETFSECSLLDAAFLDPPTGGLWRGAWGDGTHMEATTSSVTAGHRP